MIALALTGLPPFIFASEIIWMEILIIKFPHFHSLWGCF